MSNGRSARRALVGAAVVVVIASLAIWCWGWASSPGTTVLLVRHAERASQAADSPLDEAGQARAQTLVRLAGEAGVEAVFASQYLRTQQTVEPLASALGLGVTVIDAGDPAGLVSRILADHRGSTVLVAGHSNTVPEIAAQLGAALCPGSLALDAAGECMILESQFDNLFVLTVPRRGSRGLLRLRYGASTP